MSEPVEEAFAAMAAAHPRCFWLDGGGARDWSGRRSLLGWLDEDDVSLSYAAATRTVTRHAGGRSEVVAVGDGDVFAVLEAELTAGGPDDQWFGYLGYACRPDLPARPARDLPDAVWMRPSHVRVFTHHDPGRHAERAPAATRRMTSAGTVPVPEEYAAAYARVQEALHAGDSYEVNLTHRQRTTSDLDPVAAYLRLRALNPAPYAGFLQHDVPGARAWLLSSSPERYATVARTDDGGRSIETKPIKGTTPRGATPEEDAAAAERLRTEQRYRAENLMVVDLLRNDLATVCEPGSVEVPVLMDVESYASVHQLVSTVRGRLRPEVGTVAALRSLFPAGSMTGAPKRRTMEVVDAVEATPRGVYAGAFGWLAADGRADLGVVIRSLVTTGDGTWELGTGGGVTVHSDAASEHAEARWKAERLLAVFAAPVRDTRR
ncbi:anthranilate synthase component I family protein [Nocardioides abyssi]|uniref:Anthranilate synthase component I family protein n=1 Tax=Nocardioides abyssi TaxID=3058370 RepID=A0ABT8ESE4_9ACTN|nr:anthranilate synthase component I family protein [Nocardioides abyssi]MDN4160931.1 anthranilate synthase component I family protein [Nocardioides abyssi]